MVQFVRHIARVDVAASGALVRREPTAPVGSEESRFRKTETRTDRRIRGRVKERRPPTPLGRRLNHFESLIFDCSFN
jgi:hypothetical protein